MKRLVDRTSAHFDFSSPDERERSRSAAAARQDWAADDDRDRAPSADLGPGLSFELPARRSSADDEPVAPPRPPVVESEAAEAVQKVEELAKTKDVAARKKNFRKRRLSKDLADMVGNDAARASEAFERSSQFEGDELPPGFASQRGSQSSVAEEDAAAEAAASAPAEQAPPGPPPPLQLKSSSETVVGGGPTSPQTARTDGSAQLSPLKKEPINVAKSNRAVDKEYLDQRRSITFSSEMEAEEEEVTAFDRSLVGTYSCHGAEPGPSGALDKINQDCACLSHPFARTPGTSLFCVYDGHGKFGHTVSQEVLHSIYHELEENADELLADPASVLADAFDAVNAHLRLCASQTPCEVDATDSGACAVVAFMRGRELVVAGAGDCRAVLASRHEGELTAVALSTDHKVNLPGEQARIEAAGGWVRPESESDGDFNPARLYECEGKPWLGPGLCVSRCLGDLNANTCGLIPTPEVCMHTVQPSDLFLILASDGVWEFVDNTEAIKIVDHFHSKGLPALDACRYLIAKAALCWRRFEGDYRDDITAIVVYLPDVCSALEQEHRWERMRSSVRKSSRLSRADSQASERSAAGD